MSKLDIEKLKLTEAEAEQVAFQANTWIISEYKAVANAQFAKLAWGLVEQWNHNPEYGCPSCELEEALKKSGYPKPE